MIETDKMFVVVVVVVYPFFILLLRYLYNFKCLTLSRFSYNIHTCFKLC